MSKVIFPDENECEETPLIPMGNTKAALLGWRTVKIHDYLKGENLCKFVKKSISFYLFSQF